jgi:hypothetical protein
VNRSSRLIAVTLSASLAACATARGGPWVLDSPSLASRPVARAEWVASWPQALASVLDVFVTRLALPRLEVRLVFLPDDATFEALLREIGYDPELARSTAATMTGIGGHRRVLLNEARMADDGWPARVGLIAHELAHVLQYELGGGVRGASDQWLREGFADWVELQVLAAMGVVEVGPVRAELVRRTRGAHVPPLSRLATFPDWVAANERSRRVDLYGAAQLAVDLLIERHGVDAVLGYFRRFADSQQRDAHFTAAFGQTLAAFDDDFRRSLRLESR